MDKIVFTLQPPKGHSCACCDNWNAYPWDAEDFRVCILPEGAPNATWGACRLKDHPRYMDETYFSRGCNHHSKIIAAQKEKQMRDQKPFNDSQLMLW